MTSVTWGDNDTIVFGGAGVEQSLTQIPAAGGPAEPVTTLDTQRGETDHRWPGMLPGGDAFLFTVWSGPSVAAFDTAQIAVKVLATGERRQLLNGSFPHYVPSGHIVFVREDGVWAAPFDLDRLEVTGSALRVLDDIARPIRILGRGDSVSPSRATSATRSRSAALEMQMLDHGTQLHLEP